MIGTLNEGSLHAQLKAWYAQPGDRPEQPVDGYVVDLVRDELLIEIQTGGFSPLKTKLGRLLADHPVRLVAPIAGDRRIVKLKADGEVLSIRRSPKHGRVEDIFSRLVSIPTLIDHDGFELDVLVTSEDEYRVHEPGKARRRKGWVVAGRSLEGVQRSRRLSSVGDVVALLPDDLPERFSTADLAGKLEVPRRLAQQMTYCLRALGALAVAGKSGNSVEYARNG